MVALEVLGAIIGYTAGSDEGQEGVTFADQPGRLIAAHFVAAITAFLLSLVLGLAGQSQFIQSNILYWIDGIATMDAVLMTSASTGVIAFLATLIGWTAEMLEDAAIQIPGFDSRINGR